MEININHEVEDTFYRYKMPKLSAKVEGKGNGIKTVIVNVTDIAKALYRKPIYVTKFFGCELGAQIHVDEKNERYIVNGSHEAAKLQDLLHGFIKKFVLCTNCGNPETTLHVKKKAAVVATSCAACGNRGQLDPRHRLTQFIIKNPPIEETSSADYGSGRKNRRAKNGNEQDSDNEETSPICKNGHNPKVGSNDADDDDWGDDTTEEAQQLRLQELSNLARSLALSADVEKSDTERANIFYKHVNLIKKTKEVVLRAKDIKMEADRLNLGCRAILVVAEVLFSDPETLLTDIETYKSVLILFTRTGEQTQKTQSYLLGAFALLIDKNSSLNMISKSCHILKKLYDLDIVEEEVILSWFEKNGAKRYVSKEFATKLADVCAPMLKWLSEAEEESEQSEDLSDVDESDNIDVMNSPTPSDCKVAAEKYVENEDEIDIDAI